MAFLLFSMFFEVGVEFFICVLLSNYKRGMSLSNYRVGHEKVARLPFARVLVIFFLALAQV
jgi:hypothetical protein